MDSLKGQLLISGAGLYDDNFRHTVVLVGEHGDWGAVGVVLNRPLDTTVQETVPALAALAGAGALVYRGGPVEQDRAVVLVEMADAALLDVPVVGAVGFITGDVEAERGAQVLRARVLLGHAGWGAGQLEAELEAGAWITEPARAEDVFTSEPGSLWQRLLQRKGPPYDALARIPYDPRMN